ncbi:hypothetical protein CF319_g7244 [Tilletia indica]|nr:hypothetical protein CF319_g7244 [Tilletia indica]
MVATTLARSSYPYRRRLGTVNLYRTWSEREDMDSESASTTLRRLKEALLKASLSTVWEPAALDPLFSSSSSEPMQPSRSTSSSAAVAHEESLTALNHGGIRTIYRHTQNDIAEEKFARDDLDIGHQLTEQWLNAQQAYLDGLEAQLSSRRWLRSGETGDHPSASATNSADILTLAAPDIDIGLGFTHNKPLRATKLFFQEPALSAEFVIFASTCPSCPAVSKTHPGTFILNSIPLPMFLDLRLHVFPGVLMLIDYYALSPAFSKATHATIIGVRTESQLCSQLCLSLPTPGPRSARKRKVPLSAPDRGRHAPMQEEVVKAKGVPPPSAPSAAVQSSVPAPAELAIVPPATPPTDGAGASPAPAAPEEGHTSHTNGMRHTPVENIITDAGIVNECEMNK